MLLTRCTNGGMSSTMITVALTKQQDLIVWETACAPFTIKNDRRNKLNHVDNGSLTHDIDVYDFPEQQRQLAELVACQPNYIISLNKTINVSNLNNLVKVSQSNI